MDAPDQDGRKYLEENNQGVQIDSDPLRDDVPGYPSVTTSRYLDGRLAHWRNGIPCSTLPSAGENKALKRSKKRGR